MTFLSETALSANSDFGEVAGNDNSPGYQTEEVSPLLHQGMQTPMGMASPINRGRPVSEDRHRDRPVLRMPIMSQTRETASWKVRLQNLLSSCRVARKKPSSGSPDSTSIPDSEYVQASVHTGASN